jgi:predicted transcriptional regulator
MFKNLAAEMARHGLAVKDICDCLGVSEKTARNYLNGATKISWFDVLKIRNTLFSNLEISYLFAIDSGFIYSTPRTPASPTSV